MTSDDTHARTAALLEVHGHWGAAPGQVTLVKQEKVACLAGGEGAWQVWVGGMFGVAGVGCVTQIKQQKVTTTADGGGLEQETLGVPGRCRWAVI